MQDREPAPTSPLALPALLCALLGLAGAAGADLLEPIAFAFVLLPAAEAVLTAETAADEESAKADFPRRPRRPWRAAARFFFPPRRPGAVRVFRGVLHGVSLPLLA